jgi:hypothetical protein
MLIPINHRTALSPETLAKEIEVDVHAIDAGLDFILTYEHGDHAHFAFARQGQPRAWDVTVFDDGSGIVRHPTKGQAFCANITTLHCVLKDLVLTGQD